MQEDVKNKSGILSKYRRFIGFLIVISLISFLVVSLPSEWMFKSENLHMQAPFFFYFRADAKSQEQRKERVKLACNRSVGGDDSHRQWQTALAPSDFHALHFDDASKTIYCEVPKVACSNWKRVLLVLSGKIKASSLSDIPVNEVHTSLSKQHLRRMSELTLTEISERLKPSGGYFKFVFAREPFERLVSAYRNKFVAPYSLYFQKRFGRYIIRHIRGGNASAESLERGHDVTFSEFIRFITDRNITEFGKTANPHWRPISELCLPCLINYDFIGKYESMSDGDVDYVLSRLKLNHLAFPPAYHSGPNKTANLIDEYYRRVPKEDIIKLKSLFKDDFDMFYPKSSLNILMN